MRDLQSRAFDRSATDACVFYDKSHSILQRGFGQLWHLNYQGDILLSYMNTQGFFYYLNGRIIPAEKACIPVTDTGLLRGYGVVDVFTTVHGSPIFIDRHWKRFKNSASVLGLEIPVSESEFKEIVRELIEKNPCEEAVVRALLTGGPISDDGISPGDTPTLMILIEKFTPLPNEFYKSGVKVITREFQRYLPNIKHLDYIELVKLQKHKKEVGALEIVYVKDGILSEASTSNVFIIKDGKVITSKENVLGGVTRGVTIELAEKEFDVEERVVMEEEFLSADEVFLTASNKRIVPVVTIDEHTVGDGLVGPVTKTLMERFEENAEQLAQK
jgi:branched-chain amino acid aminotransferase